MDVRVKLGVIALACVTIAIGLVNSGASAAPSSDTLEGSLSIAVANDYATGKATAAFFLEVGTDAHMVQLDARPVQQLELSKLAYRRVRVRGQHVGDHFQVGSVRPIGRAASAPAAQIASGPVQPEMKLAIIVLRNKGGVGAQPPPVSDFTNLLFGQQQSVAAYFREVSGGAVTVTGRVFGPYDSQLDATSCDVDTWFGEARRLAPLNGYNPDDYNHEIVWAPGRSCPFAGIGWSPQWGGPPVKPVLINGGMSLPPFLHELGHNFGLAHAGTYVCDRPGADDLSCQYDDPLDPMSLYSSRHYQAYNKVHLGFLPAENVRTLSAPGTYPVALAPSETPIAGATQLLMLPRRDGKQYAIETRGSIGTFDQGMCACVWLRVISPVQPYEFAKFTGLMDLVPPRGPGDLLDGHLAVGATYRDAESGITIKNAGISNGVAQLQVTIDGVPPTTTTSTSTSTTTSSTTTTTVPKPSARVELQGSTLKFVDPVGRDDHVTVTSPKYHVYQVADPGVPLAAGPGCSLVGAAVQCKATVKLVDLDLGAGNDTARVDERLTTIYRGGAGDDTFVVTNTAKNDQFLGGTGIDTVDYSDRSTTHASIDGLANDGGTIEHDNIATDVENLVTGRGVDTITGGPGHNVISSGAGNDKINVKDGVADDVDCGAGTSDKVTADLADRLVNCEKVTH